MSIGDQGISLNIANQRYSDCIKSCASLDDGVAQQSCVDGCKTMHDKNVQLYKDQFTPTVSQENYDLLLDDNKALKETLDTAEAVSCAQELKQLDEDIQEFNKLKKDQSTLTTQLQDEISNKNKLEKDLQEISTSPLRKKVLHFIQAPLSILTEAMSDVPRQPSYNQIKQDLVQTQIENSQFKITELQTDLDDVNKQIGELESAVSD